MNPLKRQWEIVRLLAHGSYTLRELQDRHGVTARTILRDFVLLHPRVAR